MADPRASRLPEFLAADLPGDDSGLLDIPDVPDRNLDRYAGPRPSDGQQNIDQDHDPAAGSPSGPGNLPAPDRHRPRRYRTVPVVIEAMQWTASSTEAVQDFLGGQYVGASGPRKMRIETHQGPVPVTVGDWIVRNVNGEFWPCRSDLFAATYEATEDPLTIAGDDDGPRGFH